VTSPHQQLQDFHRRVWELNGSSWFDFEPHLTAFYSTILKPGSVAIDGGANVGLHTLPMLQAVMPDGLVVAIEPVEELRQQLLARVHDYRIPDPLLRLVPHGIASQAGEADFYQVHDPNQHPLSGLRNRHCLTTAAQVEQIRIELTTLDSVCQDLDRLDFVKLDLEGAELDALHGGVRSMARFRPVVAIEQDQLSPLYFDYTWSQLFDYFTALRYELYDLFGLHYTEPAMFEECTVWDFVAFPAEYPNKNAVFAAVRRSMQNSGIRLESTTPSEKPPAGISPGLRRSDLPAASTLDYLGPISSPSTQQSIRVAGEAAIQFSGWAVDQHQNSAAGGVDVVIDEVLYNAAYGGYRGDVANHFKNLAFQNSGFLLLLPPQTLSQGQHVVSLRVISSDREFYYQSSPLNFTVD
jgi:FkbM family methyltransferase